MVYIFYYTGNVWGSSGPAAFKYEELKHPLKRPYILSLILNASNIDSIYS